MKTIRVITRSEPTRFERFRWWIGRYILEISVYLAGVATGLYVLWVTS